MKKIVYVGALVGTLCWATACENNSRSDDSVENAEEMNEQAMDMGESEDEDMAEFMVEAANGGLMEVELGRIAAEKATNPQVKEFGQMMVDNHSKANDKLKTLASQKGITLPTSVGEEHQKEINRLTELSGEEFDREYVKLMVKDHKADIDEFQEATDEVEDPDVKAFASQTLPTLQRHLQRAEQIEDSIENQS
ncbi:putative membrane protein [Catalinimonas alkaloidigena]|uniref:Putative membrane protein n=1 Tax=Catalinimonas alkaloidigena TaxID=1075417 RepID=A0A1G9SFZ2_9BACT|nr:DUF4142 domain-containing protein [Catalinimonas alkaloidigena]SDM34321.1 putative membrane protein [Catalinimonas alkaloidigena]